MPLITYRKALNDALAEELDPRRKRGYHRRRGGRIQRRVQGDRGALGALRKQAGGRCPHFRGGICRAGRGRFDARNPAGHRADVLELCLRRYDQIVNNAGCVRYMSGGRIHCPIVIRGPANAGTNVGATHSHTPENILANVPGLKVVCPATAYDAKGLMKTAIRDNDPVMFMENTLLYGEKWEVPEEEYLVPMGVADVKRIGTDVSLIAHGRAAMTALKAAELLAAEHNIDAEVVDLRSIRPLDEEAVLQSVRKTHRAVVVEENKPFCGVASQIAATIQEKAFDDLDAPVLRISSLDAPAIYSPPLEKIQLPTPQLVIQKVLSIC